MTRPNFDIATIGVAHAVDAVAGLKSTDLLKIENDWMMTNR